MQLFVYIIKVTISQRKASIGVISALASPNEFARTPAILLYSYTYIPTHSPSHAHYRAHHTRWCLGQCPTHNVSQFSLTKSGHTSSSMRASSTGWPFMTSPSSSVTMIIVALSRFQTRLGCLSSPGCPHPTTDSLQPDCTISRIPNHPLFVQPISVPLSGIGISRAARNLCPGPRPGTRYCTATYLPGV